MCDNTRIQGHNEKVITFFLAKLRFIFSIYLDPTKATKRLEGISCAIQAENDHNTTSSTMAAMVSILGSIPLGL